jgi:hypothetical protein
MMRGLVFALLGQAALGACSIDARANPGARCDEVTSCALPQVCYRGFCVNSDDVPAIELDAAPTPVRVGDASLSPSTSATSLEAGAPVTPATNATPHDAGAPMVPAAQTPVVPPAQTPVVPPAQTPAVPPAQTPVVPPAQTPVVPPAQTPMAPSAASPSDAAAPVAVVPPTPVDAAVSPPTQVSTPPVQVATPPAQPSAPAASVPDPAQKPGTAPSVEPPVPTPGMPASGDPSGKPEDGDGEMASPLLACLPVCVTRSVLCLVCLSGGLGSPADNCDARKQRANPNVRDMCEFLCSTLGCKR